ncbi:hypothetical protein SAMN05443244_3046 [Terriglobus roseus]|uniref:MetA-pathway of phenol degradation n=2 Tax=Terriglobus roseus TaxID=392734 RepID=A0A1H4R3R6_9BACT|nr:hypothetical protein SAMN05443244_3046 [Terriglobus roseus]
MSDDELALAVASSLGPSGIIPFRSGFNASIITSSQFDTVTGWANVLTPSLAYRFNRYFSADVSAPIFLYLRSQHTVDTTIPGQAPSFTRLTDIRHGVPGDTVMAAHWSSKHFDMGKAGSFGNTLTGSLSAPTGSSEDGIGAGKVTYNFTDHVQSDAFLAPYIDVGIGTTSRLQNQRLQRSQTSRGNLFNLGAGVSLELPRASTIYLEGYEQLPLGSQTVFQTDPRSGRPGQATVQTNSGLAEDNGVNLSLDVPVAPHAMWSGFYSHGFRLHEDTVGFAFTFLLRSPQRLPRSR